MYNVSASNVLKGNSVTPDGDSKIGDAGVLPLIIFGVYFVIIFCVYKFKVCRNKPEQPEDESKMRLLKTESASDCPSVKLGSNGIDWVRRPGNYHEPLGEAKFVEDGPEVPSGSEAAIHTKARKKGLEALLIKKESKVMLCQVKEGSYDIAYDKVFRNTVNPQKREQIERVCRKHDIDYSFRGEITIKIRGAAGIYREESIGEKGERREQEITFPARAGQSADPKVNDDMMAELKRKFKPVDLEEAIALLPEGQGAEVELKASDDDMQDDFRVTADRKSKVSSMHQAEVDLEEVIALLPEGQGAEVELKASDDDMQDDFRVTDRKSKVSSMHQAEVDLEEAIAFLHLDEHNDDDDKEYLFFIKGENIVLSPVGAGSYDNIYRVVGRKNKEVMKDLLISCDKDEETDEKKTVGILINNAECIRVFDDLKLNLFNQS